MENQSFFIIKSNLPYQQQVNLADTKEQVMILLLFFILRNNISFI